jgi:predicted PurR-regulated permease PerM
MLLLVFMITGFLLVDSERIKKFFLNMIPQNDRKSFENFLSRLDQRLSGVVRGQLTICLINAILTLIGLLIFNINFAFILATIAGILSLVPIFGSIISTIPIVLVALTSSPITALAALLWVIGIHTLEANFLNPKIMGDSAKIHPILIILSLVAGERFYGMIGALLAVPIMSIIVTIFMSILSRAKHIEGLAKPGRNDRIASKEV